LIYRGIVLEGLLKKYSPIFAILFSAFLFAIAHLNPWQFVVGMVMGIFNGWIYFKVRNLLYPILAQ
jgi:membrane protease YdiL (CAAX protease family)